MGMNRRVVNGLLCTAYLFLCLNLSAQTRSLTVKAVDGTQLGSFKASYALVIGESAYTDGWPKLAGVKTDVQLVSKALGDSGFQVTVRQDLSSDAVKQAYEDFIETYGLDEGNRLLFYYAGHGHTLKLAGGRDMGYIVPVDTPNPNDDANGFKKKAIPMNFFDTWAKQIEARHALFLFDSCFSGSIFNVTRAVPDNINEKTVRAVRQFITSGSADETVPDKSVFRDQFLVGIAGEADRNADGYVTGAELGEFLDEKVVNYSKKTQHPQYGKIQDPALDKGDFVFAVPVGAKVVQSPEPSGSSGGSAKPSFGAVVIATGNLSITLATAGTISVAGLSADVPAGTVPVNNLSAGSQEVTVRYADGKTEAKFVDVEAGRTAALSFSYRLMNASEATQTVISVIEAYQPKRPQLSWFTAIGVIRTRSKDPTPYSVVVNVLLGYDLDNKVFQNELSDRLYELKDFVRIFFSLKTASELNPENESQLKLEMRTMLNERLLKDARIREILFQQLDVVEM